MLLFFSWFFRLLGWQTKPETTAPSPSQPAPQDSGTKTSDTESHAKVPHKSSEATRDQTAGRARPHSQRESQRGRLYGARRTPSLIATRRNQKGARFRPRSPVREVAGQPPYKYARYGSRTGNYLDLSTDGNAALLQQRGLPVFQTPEELAHWLQIPLHRLAWLVHRFSYGRAETVEQAHFVFRWVQKHSGGWRLIESPKQSMKQVQQKILHEILNKVPAHSAAHGFVKERSILTNALPHVGQEIVVKMDLTNFYTTISFARVVAIFRAIGYSREAAIWLSLLTTSALPGNAAFPFQDPYACYPYWRRHLPQGAPTSPALANLSAYRLDLRLHGLSRSYGATYTRYADDMAISGPKDLSYGLRDLIPLVEKIIHQERFQVNRAKRRVLRSHQRQVIAGVVVNEKPNVSRADFDRLKATLTNCVRHGPASQNRDQLPDFAAHLRGRIAHIQQLNPARGDKLMVLFNRIRWA